MRIAAVIPAYNEESRISGVIQEVEDYVDGVLVVDDCSSDETAEVARKAGADVVVHEENKGYLGALRTGFREIDEGVVVTLDADGEMDPEYIPDLVKPIERGEADLVMGRRKKVPRISERFLNTLAGFRTDISDTGTGYRAVRKDLVEEMELYGVCTCGTFVLEAEKLGAEIGEVSVETRDIEKERTVAWKHFRQFWYVVGAVIGV